MSAGEIVREEESAWTSEREEHGTDAYGGKRSYNVF